MKKAKSCDNCVECYEKEYLETTIQRLKKELKEKESIIRKYRYDYLTNFMLRADFQDRLKELWYEYETFGNRFILGLVDLDNLHEINRSKGYEAGDEFIIITSRRIKSAFEDANCFRIGGDEFAILKRGNNLEEFENRLNKIKDITYFYASCTGGFDNSTQMFKKIDEGIISKKNSKKRI